jgi:hypothetical protein
MKLRTLCLSQWFRHGEHITDHPQNRRLCLHVCATTLAGNAVAGCMQGRTTLVYYRGFQWTIHQAIRSRINNAVPGQSRSKTSIPATFVQAISVSERTKPLILLAHGDWLETFDSDRLWPATRTAINSVVVLQPSQLTWEPYCNPDAHPPIRRPQWSAKYLQSIVL